MQELILKLAKEISDADEVEMDLLELLCQSAQQAWTARLRADVTVEDCGGAFPCAAAMTAGAELVDARDGGAVSAFTAGAVSVQSGDAAARSGHLRGAAERLMAPYAAAEDFSFRSVRG